LQAHVFWSVFVFPDAVQFGGERASMTAADDQWSADPGYSKREYATVEEVAAELGRLSVPARPGTAGTRRRPVRLSVVGVRSVAFRLGGNELGPEPVAFLSA